MTPISEMTNDQLDRWIAEKRGWKYYPNGKWKWVLYYADEECEGEYQYTCPSYTTDARYAFELLEEMKARLTFDDDYSQWECEYFTKYSEEDEQHKFCRADTLCRSIAIGWAEWRGGE